MPRPFAELLTPETLKPLAEASMNLRLKRGTEVTYEQHDELLSTVLAAPVAEHMRGLLKEGRLQPVPNGEGRRLHIQRIWNRMLRTGKTEEMAGYLGKLLYGHASSMPIHQAAKLGYATITPTTLMAIHKPLVDWVETGSFPWNKWSGVDHCKASKQQVWPQLDGWQLSYLQHDLAEGIQLGPMLPLKGAAPEVEPAEETPGMRM